MVGVRDLGLWPCSARCVLKSFCTKCSLLPKHVQFEFVDLGLHTKVCDGHPMAILLLCAGGLRLLDQH
jgi:hypothetical protein